MNDNAKVFSLIEMREMMIDTSDYQMMEEVGEFTGTLEMKAQGHKKSIRIFLSLDDGRKIITPIFWWQTYLGFYYMPIGTKLRLFYSESSLNKIYLEKVEVIGQDNEAKLKADLIVAEALQKPDSEGYPKLTEEHPFFGRLRYFMADKSHWLGTATDLLNAMNDTATPPNTVTKLLNKFSIDLYFSDGIDVHFGL